MTEDRLQSTTCAQKLKALGEPLRLRIVDCLRAGPMTVSEICEAIETEIVTVSHHLGVLRNASIVERTKNGRFAVYRLSEGTLELAENAKSNDFIDLGCCRIEIPK